jgi:inosose dehydratase
MDSSFHRRRFLLSLAATAALTSRPVASAMALSNAAAQATPASGAASIQFGAQTNAWPIQPAKFDTFLQALSDIKATGYNGFETGFVNLRSQAKTLQQARKQIEATGLTFLGIHIFLPEYDPSTSIAPRAFYESVAQQGAATGAQRLILSGAPTVTADETKRKADALNAAGEYAKTLGLTVAYHNHWWEAKYKAKELEALYAGTDPAKVQFLMDIGHASRTDLDLPDFVKRHAARLTGLHFRDFVNGKQVPLGQGNFPLEKVAAALKQVRWTGWVINEEEREDSTKLGLSVMQPSLQALKGVFSA